MYLYTVLHLRSDINPKFYKSYVHNGLKTTVVVTVPLPSCIAQMYD